MLKGPNVVYHSTQFDELSIFCMCVCMCVCNALPISLDFLRDGWTDFNEIMANERSICPIRPYSILL